MPYDPSTLPPVAREKYIRVGRLYSSVDTLAQAEQTQLALREWGRILVEHGFALADGEKLADIHALLQTAFTGREETKTAKKNTSLAFGSSFDGSKKTRLQARSILGNVLHDLSDSTATGAAEAMRGVEVLLDGTSHAGADPVTLATQLDQLRDGFRNPLVTEIASSRGGAAIVTDLEGRARALRSAAAAHLTTPGTPAQTETLDLLDGLIVFLARRARSAARSAAKSLGQPAIATAFELTHLKRSSGRRGEPVPEPEPGPAPSPEPKPVGGEK